MIDTSFALRGPSGTAVYGERLVAALRALGADVVEARNTRRPPPGGGGLRSARNLAVDRWWTAVELPRRARAARADVLHHVLPALAPRAVAPAQVVTVHDLAFEKRPQDFDPRFARWARRAHRRAARGAGAVVAVSEATERDVRERWGVTRVVVARHGPGQELDVRRGEPRHFLYVGDDEPRKDVAALRAAHAALGPGAPPLVLAGAAGGRRVSAAELADLHAHAHALVHPSRDEGFGLTVLEALAAGTPVVARPCAAVREVAGDAAILTDDLAAGMREALARGDELAAKGRERAARFSWEACARAHLDAYALALAR
jgi:glycosyltransferase involved in cell wall biosynthesis